MPGLPSKSSGYPLNECNLAPCPVLGGLGAQLEVLDYDMAFEKSGARGRGSRQRRFLLTTCHHRLWGMPLSPNENCPQEAGRAWFSGIMIVLRLNFSCLQWYAVATFPDKSRQIRCQKNCVILIAHVLQSDNSRISSNHDKHKANLLVYTTIIGSWLPLRENEKLTAYLSAFQIVLDPWQRQTP